jgi:hypothetical protein
MYSEIRLEVLQTFCKGLSLMVNVQPDNKFQFQRVEGLDKFWNYFLYSPLVMFVTNYKTQKYW